MRYMRIARIFEAPTQGEFTRPENTEEDG